MHLLSFEKEYNVKSTYNWRKRPQTSLQQIVYANGSFNDDSNV